MRTGTIPGFNPPSRWPTELKKRWSLEVGEGHASPVIGGEWVYLFSRESEQEVVRAISLKTGLQRWIGTYSAPYEMHQAARGHGKGPKSTPTLVDGRLFTLGISGILAAWNAETGAELWRRDFKSEFKTTSPLYGAAASPLVDRDRVIVPIGGHNAGGIAAFDVRTGAEKWRWAEDGPAYASPILVRTPDGTRHVVTQSQKFCLGLDADSGRLLWSRPFTTPFDQNSITPLPMGELILFAGVRQPTFAVRLRKTEAGWFAEKEWETPQVTLYMSCPVYRDGRVYGMSERSTGQLFVLNAVNGEVLWLGEGRYGDNAAILDGGNVILALNTAGELSAWRKEKESPALSHVGRYKVSETPTWSAPAVDGRLVAIKDLKTVTLWEI